MRDVVIMAGGSGRRFWPVSREAYPKQFLTLYGNRSLLQYTYQRVRRIVPSRNIYVSTRSGLEAIILKQIPSLGKDKIIVEPVGRDTAPSIALSCLWVMKGDPNPTMMFVPADHYVSTTKEFAETTTQALSLAEETDSIVTIGVRPTYPSTGYGYIQCDMKHVKGEASAYRVLSFKEKPSLTVAKRYLQKGNYFWNSGIFVAKAGTMMEQLRVHSPKVFQFAKCLAAVSGSAFRRKLQNSFYKMPKVSFDYAVMEKARNVLMVPARFSWNDLGSWSSLDQLPHLRRGRNVSLGQVFMVGSERNIVSSAQKLTVLIDVKDLVVAVADQAVLVCHKDSAQKVKEAVMSLRQGRYASYT